MADTIQLRHKDTGEVIERAKGAAKFYPDYDVLTADGRVNAKATAAAHTTTKES